jgi:hypothetical protein
VNARDIRVEAVDPEMAEILRRKTPAERLAIAAGLWRSARVLLTSNLRSLHPDWDEARLQREVVRRLSRGAV